LNPNRCIRSANHIRILTEKKDNHLNLSHATSQLTLEPFQGQAPPLRSVRRHLGAAQRQSIPATPPPEMHHPTRKSPQQPKMCRLWARPCTYVFLFIIIIFFEPEVTQRQRADLLLFTALLNRLPMGLIDGRRCASPQRHPLRRPGSRCRSPQKASLISKSAI